MKKLKYLLLAFALMILPLGVCAEEKEKDVKEEVKVYFFMGDGCSFCQKAKDWFNSIEKEHGDKYEIVSYETWYNEENAELMNNVAKTRGEEASGVPYIVIGNKSWNGFDDVYKDEIIDQIKSEYETDVDQRYDIMKLIKNVDAKDENKNTKDVISLILILVIVGAFGFGIYKARQTTN